MRFQFLILALFATTLTFGQGLIETLHFDHDSYTLSQHDKEMLDGILRDCSGGCQISVTGHTDNAGSNSYNAALSRERAEATSKYLVEHGVDVKDLSSFYKGESAPVISNDDPSKMQQNRRVEVTWTYKGLDDISDLMAKLDNPVHRFEVSNKQQTTITGANNTRITIPADAFKTKDGESPSNVIIELQEAYSLEQMVRGGLVTSTNGQMLSSNGMIRIQAFADGKLVDVRQGAELTIEMPQVSTIGGMHLYSGIKGDGDQINWIALDVQDEEGVQVEKGTTTDDLTDTPTVITIQRLGLDGIFGGRTAGYLFVGIWRTITFQPFWPRHEVYSVKDAKKFEQENSEEPDKILTTSRSGDITNYVFSTAKLGWYNIDALMKRGTQRVITQVEPTKDTKVFIIFKHLRSVQTMMPYRSNYQFNAPKSRNATIVALKVVDGTPFIALRDINTRIGRVENLKFVPASLTTLKEMIGNLDS